LMSQFSLLGSVSRSFTHRPVRGSVSAFAAIGWFQKLSSEKNRLGGLGLFSAESGRLAASVPERRPRKARGFTGVGVAGWGVAGATGLDGGGFKSR